MAAAESEYSVGSANRPEHSGALEAGTDHRLTACLDDARTYEQMLLAKLGITPVVTSRGGFTLPPPPAVEKRPVTDTYKVTGGADVTVTDDYRYLEDARSPETRANVAAQNAYTQTYLNQLKILPEARRSMAALLKVDEMSVPVRRGERLFFSKRRADENQGSIYMRTGLYGADVKLIDGPGRSADGNTSVNMMGLTEDGSTLVYGVRVGGADEREVHFFDVAARKDMGDVLPSARYSGVAIAPDKKGVYYSRFFPHMGTEAFYHAWGTAVGPEADKLLLGGEYHGERLGEIDSIHVRVTENGH